MGLPMDTVTQYIAVAAGLGTAAFALVDASKAFAGGVSNHGFNHVKQVVSDFFTAGGGEADPSSPLRLDEVLATLRANWLNGNALSDQKAIAKSLIKLRLNEANAQQLAKATGVSGEMLTSVAGKIASGEALTQQENDVFGRFDLMLTALLDRGYQRADQSYRNKAKAWSIVASVALALCGKWIADIDTVSYSKAFLVGLVATPIAPVAKDLTSALQAGVKAAQMLRK
jgi:hypothetical protein